jgi:hypothetical protein
MEETYRMLGREHQADLDREASTRALASLLPARPPIATRAVGGSPELRAASGHDSPSLGRPTGLKRGSSSLARFPFYIATRRLSGLH